MNKLYMGVVALALCLGFTACSEDDGPVYGTATVQNTELKTILAQKGYQFNADGNLLLDELANNTTALDLSGTNISTDALAELSILPNLTEVDLSDNGYGPAFDFSKLPEQITGVDLTGNEIYEYTGLVNVVAEDNGDETVTVLHPLNKLYLPQEAKYDCNQLVYAYENMNGIDMQMENASGSNEAYTTLREVPNEETRATLKEAFPNYFDGDKINIAKRVTDALQQNQAINVDVPDAEGIEYIAYHRSYKGVSIRIADTDETPSILPFCKVNSNLTSLQLDNVNTPNGIDLSEAKSLVKITSLKNESISSIDLSASELLGQREPNLEFNILAYGSIVRFEQCPKLKTIILPEKMDKLSQLTLVDLPLLERMDLSKIKAMYSLNMALLPQCKITYPAFQYYMYGVNVDNEKGTVYFGIDKDIYDRQETKDFIATYGNKCSVSSIFLNNKYIGYDWKNPR